MELVPPANPNYAAVVLKIGDTHTLDGLDNLVGVSVLGCQALIEKGHQPGETLIAFTAETQLSEELARENNLNRKVELNKDVHAEPGYLDDKRRVRAIRLRGHRSDALLLPLSSVAYTGIDIDDLQPGDTFDQLNGHEICKKYEIPVRVTMGSGAQVKKLFKRVDNKVFPMHVSTGNFWRAFGDLKADGSELIVTQKLHGTSGRWGRVPALNPPVPVPKGLNRLREYFGFAPKYKDSPETRPADTVWSPDPEFVAGSKMVIKDLDTADDDAKARTGFYKVDIWAHAAREFDLPNKLPENYVIYGELIGWIPGTETPIQKGYTYDQPQGRYGLYVYRVAVVNRTGQLADLPWDAVKQFCAERGLKTTPELDRLPASWVGLRSEFEELVDTYLDERYIDTWVENPGAFTERPVSLSGGKKMVDEGICIRQEGVIPTILKAKSPIFLQHETKQLDAGEVDVESAESVEVAA